MAAFRPVFVRLWGFEVLGLRVLELRAEESLGVLSFRASGFGI